MHYVSTRDCSLRYTASQAIEQGLSRDGGLFLPEEFPVLPDLSKLTSMTYQQRAAAIMHLFLPDFSLEELAAFCGAAYGPDRFDHSAVAPLRALHCKTHVLELWHGPTCAFKDMALQMLPHLLTASMEKNGEKKTVSILVATSGDTGKAALEGFRDVPGTNILVFYPKDGVSNIQELQMVTQQGGNVNVCAVEGNFDDAQNGVKQIFSDASLRQILANRGYVLSSANSINWGRVLPQIVYYISAYCDLAASGAIQLGDTVNVAVPTGNFGNILACYYAKKMGLPVGKLICASNSNNVLTDFLRTGTYDKNRPFYHTISPSMDILISSNLERLLYELTGSDQQVRRHMEELSKSGRYTVDATVMKRIGEEFAAGFCNDERAKKTIASVFQNYKYLMDPHTAVAYTVLQEYRAATADDTPAIVVSTASPFKFCSSVLDALGEKKVAADLNVLQQLSNCTGCPVPRPLAALSGLPVRFVQHTAPASMARVVDLALR